MSHQKRVIACAAMLLCGVTMAGGALAQSLQTALSVLSGKVLLRASDEGPRCRQGNVCDLDQHP